MSAIINASQAQHHDQGSRLALAIERIIRPFIKLIVGRVSCGFLIQQVKRIYIEEARAWIENNDANGRVTKSKLAMLTGLDTRTISSFEESAITADQAQLGDLCAEAAVLDLWNSDAKYRDEDDRPAVLPIFGRGVSFQTLVSSTVGRNVTCQTVLERLLASGNIELVDDNFVALINPFYQPVKESEGTVFDYGSISISRLIETINFNLECEDKRDRMLHQDRWSMRIRKSDVKAMESELRTLVDDQILDVEKLLVKYEQSDDQEDTVSYGVGWFFFSD